MGVFDYSALTLNPREAQTVSEAAFKKTLLSPKLQKIHRVDTSVDMDKYIPIFGRLGLIGKVDPGACNSNLETGTIPVSQKLWTPKLISGRLKHCEGDLPQLLKLWGRTKPAVNSWEFPDNDAMQFVLDRVTEAVGESIIRIAEFADTDNSPVGDNTGNQLLTSGTTKTYFNMIDGLWKQIFDSTSVYRYTITENAEANKTAQLNLAADAAIKVFRALYNNIAPEAFNGQLVFQVSRSLYENWLNFLEEKSLSFTISKVEAAESNTYTYRGIPIVPRYDWDRIIRTYFDNGTTYFLPHRAILADINNIPIGTSDVESFTTLDSFYDRTDKAHYIDFAYRLDCKLLVDEEVAVAY